MEEYYYFLVFTFIYFCIFFFLCIHKSSKNLNPRVTLNPLSQSQTNNSKLTFLSSETSHPSARSINYYYSLIRRSAALTYLIILIKSSFPSCTVWRDANPLLLLPDCLPSRAITCLFCIRSVIPHVGSVCEGVSLRNMNIHI